MRDHKQWVVRACFATVLGKQRYLGRGRPGWTEGSCVSNPGGYNAVGDRICQ